MIIRLMDSGKAVPFFLFSLTLVDARGYNDTDANKFGKKTHKTWRAQEWKRVEACGWRDVR